VVSTSRYVEATYWPDISSMAQTCLHISRLYPHPQFDSTRQIDPRNWLIRNIPKLLIHPQIPTLRNAGFADGIIELIEDALPRGNLQKTLIVSNVLQIEAGCYDPSFSTEKSQSIRIRLSGRVYKSTWNSPSGDNIGLLIIW